MGLGGSFSDIYGSCVEDNLYAMVDRVALRLFFFFALTFLLLSSREPPGADAQVVYETTRALVERRALDLPQPSTVPAVFVVSHNGKQYGLFPLAEVAAMVPGYLLWKALSASPRLSAVPALYALCSHLSAALLMAGAAALFFRLCRWRGASGRLATGLTLALGLSTICFCYARTAYPQALQTFALLLWTGCVLRQGERMSAAGMLALGAASGLLLSSGLAYVIVLPLAVVFLIARGVAARQKGQALPAAAVWKGALLAVLAFLPFVALALWHNWLKTGSPLRTGFELQIGVFARELWPALYTYALSPGQSVFLYSPPLVLGALGAATALRRHRLETLFVLAVLAACLLWQAKRRLWHGDFCWGPRPLVPLTPLALLLALPWLPEALASGRGRLRQAALVLLIAGGAAVQLLGSAFSWELYVRILTTTKERTGAGGWFVDQLEQADYIPQFSPLRGHAWLLSHWLRGDPDLGRDAPWRLLVPQPVDLRAYGKALRLDFCALDVFAKRVDNAAPPPYR